MENIARESSILTTKNSFVNEVNQKALERMPGDERVYTSADSVDDSGDIDPALFPAEFLNTLRLSGLPEHELRLKPGTPILLLRNINARAGLCNGTRLIVRHLLEKSIECLVASGGTVIFLPRITCISDGKDMPFKLRRRQFPVRVCFAMTINKSQGQSLDRVGIYLPEKVWQGPLFLISYVFI